MSKDVKELLKEATKDLLTPETLTAIEEAVNAKAEEKSRLQVEAALIAQDDKHSTMLQSLMEKMDTDYTTKLQKLIERVDQSYATKLLNVKKHYDGKLADMNKQLNEAAEKYVNSLSTKIDNFLESKVDALLPVEKLNEAVENVKAVRLLEHIRALVGIDENCVTSEVKNALIDGKKQIDESKTELARVINENAQLKSSLQRKEVDLLLEQKTSKFPTKKKEHIKRVLGTKDVKFINENLEYVADMFNKEEVLEATKAKTDAKVIGTSVDAPVIINESIKNQDPISDTAPFMTDYLNNLKR